MGLISHKNMHFSCSNSEQNTVIVHVNGYNQMYIRVESREWAGFGCSVANRTLRYNDIH
jgi:hypothetical protein